MRAWATARASGLGRDEAEEVAAEACAEVWRTFNLARGGAAFEGFVQGRFVEAARRVRPSPAADGASPAPTVGMSLAAPVGGAGLDTRLERLRAGLEELRVRNPRHHRALSLIYLDEATFSEAADALAVDVWTVRSLVARARQALARSLERRERTGGPAIGRRAGAPPAARPKRPGGMSGGQRKGRPPAGGRPR